MTVTVLGAMVPTIVVNDSEGQQLPAIGWPVSLH